MKTRSHLLFTVWSPRTMCIVTGISYIVAEKGLKDEFTGKSKEVLKRPQISDDGPAMEVLKFWRRHSDCQAYRKMLHQDFLTYLWLEFFFRNTMWANLLHIWKILLQYLAGKNVCRLGEKNRKWDFLKASENFVSSMNVHFCFPSISLHELQYLFYNIRLLTICWYTLHLKTLFLYNLQLSQQFVRVMKHT